MFQFLILNVIKLIKAMVETPQEESEFIKWQFEGIEHRVSAKVKKMSLSGKKTKRKETSVLMLHVSPITVIFLRDLYFKYLLLILECSVELGHSH